MTGCVTTKKGHFLIDMKPDESKPVSVGKPKRIVAKENPEWANGLRKLYDSVVEEPLPDQFKDLLSKLDAKD